MKVLSQILTIKMKFNNAVVFLTLALSGIKGALVNKGHQERANTGKMNFQFLHIFSELLSDGEMAQIFTNLQPGERMAPCLEDINSAFLLSWLDADFMFLSILEVGLG